MSKVVCFGEALIDLYATGEDNAKIYRRFPGGAPANVAVAVATLGGQARFSGQVGRDSFGDYLVNSIKAHGVDTDFLSQHVSANTALAFIDIDNFGERSFSFYRRLTADLLMQPSQVSTKWFEDAGLFHFCSNTMTTVDMELVTEKAVNMARREGCLVSFDVNLRHNLWPELKVNQGVVNDFVRLADILKFSADELAYLSAGETSSFIESLLQEQARLIIVTDGPRSIRYYTSEIDQKIKPPSVKALDTTAAGDAFVGGLLFSLSNQSNPVAAIQTAESLKKMIQFASCCGAITVTKPGAFPALPSLSEVQSLATEVNLFL